MNDERTRCWWANGPDERMRDYHDREWGVPVHEERKLFELLVLEGAQAGLSWSTILNRRDGYRRAFDGFDVDAVAQYGPDDEARLLADPGIIRNRAKIASAIANARAVIAVRETGTSVDELMWSFISGAMKVNRFNVGGSIPAETPESQAMSKELRKRGFTFVGPTICYAHMQSAGMVNDHLVDCFRWAEVQRERT